jgi:hypothetical protein
MITSPEGFFWMSCIVVFVITTPIVLPYYIVHLSKYSLRIIQNKLTIKR